MTRWAATVAVQDTTPEFAADMATVAAGMALSGRHSDYLVEVTRALLDLAVERGEIEAVDTVAAARMIAGLGREFARAEVMPSPNVALTEQLDVAG